MGMFHNHCREVNSRRLMPAGVTYSIDCSAGIIVRLEAEGL